MPPAASPSAPRFAAYLRVSIDKQGWSGLGLEAQRVAVDAHAAGVGGTMTAEFIEVENGRKKEAALGAARARGPAR